MTLPSVAAWKVTAQRRVKVDEREHTVDLPEFFVQAYQNHEARTKALAVLGDNVVFEVSPA